jgi:hypothetical protein
MTLFFTKETHHPISAVHASVPELKLCYGQKRISGAEQNSIIGK